MNNISTIRTIDNVYDSYLGVNTESDDEDRHSNTRKIFYDYEPTSYAVLEEIFRKYPFDNGDHMIDFGSGKGRVLIMAAYYFCINLTGYELDSRRYNITLDNIQKFQQKFNVNSNFIILNENVENINIANTTNKFFFFNPFHLKIYMKTINAIRNSLLQNERSVQFYFCHPIENAVKYMESIKEFKKIDFKECEFNAGNNHYFEYIVFSN
jgi:tRNA A58 N-methylase Trm61